ncbi:hypothetical protein RQP46_001584 [Phenoliferia psychrophenolica]
MLRILFAVLLVPPALALADSPPPPPFPHPQQPQTHFASPQPAAAAAADAAHLIQLSYSSQSAAQSAYDALSSTHDIWAYDATSFHLAASPSALSQSLPPSSSDEPPLLTPLSPLSTLLSQPTLQPSYNLLASSALISNLSSLSTTDRSSLLRGDEMHSSFHPLDNLVELMRALVDESPMYAEMVEIAKSAEGRIVWGLKVTNRTHQHPHPGDDDDFEDEEEDGEEMDEAELMRKKKHGRKGGKGKKRPQFPHKLGFVVAGTQHAREWISASTALYAAHQLLLSTLPPSPSPPSHLQSCPRLLDIFEFTFIPVVNVDGYAYTWTSDRLWRKNRQVVDPKSRCVGIDLNRNWGHRFEKGQRPNACSEAFAGDEPFQATELLGLSSYLSNSSNHVAAFVDLHSYGQMLMFPWSYSCKKRTADDEDLFEAAIGASKAIRSVHGRSFEVGSVCQVSLSSPGESVDWTYADAKIRWSFAVELRGGVYGFLLPPSQILPSGEETLAGLVSLAEFVAKKEAAKKIV